MVKAKIGILSGAALMVRFGKKSSNSSHSVYRQKGKEAFMEWSQKNDPDSYSWWVVDELDPKKGYQINESEHLDIEQRFRTLESRLTKFMKSNC